MRNLFAPGRNKLTMAVIAAASVAMLGLVGNSANAQEISESHLAAAKKTISATGATVKLNEILPASAIRLAGQLIGNRPDIEAEITLFVNESALELAPRRGDLEKEVAKIYGRLFTEQELLDISKFFATDAGKKFLANLPIAVREVDKASRVWGTGINRDLGKKVGDKLRAAKL